MRSAKIALFLNVGEKAVLKTTNKFVLSFGLASHKQKFRLCLRMLAFGLFRKYPNKFIKIEFLPRTEKKIQAFSLLSLVEI